MSNPSSLWWRCTTVFKHDRLLFLFIYPVILFRSSTQTYYTSSESRGLVQRLHQFNYGFDRAKWKCHLKRPREKRWRDNSRNQKTWRQFYVNVPETNILSFTRDTVMIMSNLRGIIFYPFFLRETGDYFIDPMNLNFRVEGWWRWYPPERNSFNHRS